MATVTTLSTRTQRLRRAVRRLLRKQVLDALHSLAGVSAGVSSGSASEQYLAQIANTLSRYAQTNTTVFDDGGTSTPNGPAAGNLLARQAERALTQVLGRGVGKDS